MAITYSRAIVSYVDVLGFKKLVLSSSAEDVANVISRHQRIPNWSIYSHKSRTGNPIWKPVRRAKNYSFSDLFVSVNRLPRRSTSFITFGKLFEDLKFLGEYQFRLACAGIFVRGAITVGDIYFRKQTIFGPALVSAYETERSLAKWPIIVVDESIRSEVERIKTGYLRYRERKFGPNSTEIGKEHLEDLSSFIATTNEGVPFVNYLSCAKYDVDTQDDTFDRFSTSHRASLVNCSQKYPEYAATYEFVLSYHDDWLKKFGLRRYYS